MRRTPKQLAAHRAYTEIIAAREATEYRLPQTVWALAGGWPYLSRESTSPAPKNATEPIVTMLPATWFD